MGKPAESRSLLGHLINVSYPYNYSSPEWELFCQGITELTETFEADTEDVQYICEITKTTNVKGFTVGFDLEIAYVKGEKCQRWVNRIVRVPPTGAATSCDYIRFNKDEIMYGTSNQFIGVRRKAIVYPNSIGGAANESLKTSVHISGTSDPQVGYITVDSSGETPVFSWTPATTEVPIIKTPTENSILSGENVTVSGLGIVGATVVVYYGQGKSTSPVTVNESGVWTTTISSSNLDTNVKIATIQSINGMSSVTSDPVSFTLIKNLEAPVITVPANGATNVELTPTIAGTGRPGATVNVSDGTNTILTVSVNSDSTWSGVLSNSLTAGHEYTINATQTLGTTISSPSSNVSFRARSE